MIEVKITNETLAGALHEMAGASAFVGAVAKPPVVQASALTAPGIEASATAQQPPTAPPAPIAPAPQYTLDQIGKAGAEMIAAEPAKMPQLRALLQQFGVAAIAQLQPDQMGTFVTALRGLGAKL